MEVLAERLECLEASWKDVCDKRALCDKLAEQASDAARVDLEGLEQRLLLARIALAVSEKHLNTDREALVDLVQVHFV